MEEVIKISSQKWPHSSPKSVYSWVVTWEHCCVIPGHSVSLSSWFEMGTRLKRVGDKDQFTKVAANSAALAIVRTHFMILSLPITRGRLTQTSEHCAHDKTWVADDQDHFSYLSSCPWLMADEYTTFVNRFSQDFPKGLLLDQLYAEHISFGFH